mmetsp:Transcript_35373/g.57681  ORF Transcript_35373/g.57681 Transcript_35373/m.57681 type:complete len:158 (-) Transcript_35373:831-1304(-)
MGGDDVDDEGKECDSDGVQRQLQHQNQAPQQQQNHHQGVSLEGRHEIASAKRRLATAKTWNESTSEAVKSAQDQLESARAQFQASRTEVDKAKSCLGEAYKRWEVMMSMMKVKNATVTVFSDSCNIRTRLRSSNRSSKIRGCHASKDVTRLRRQSNA